MAAIFEEFANGEDFNASDWNTYGMRQVIIACDNQTDRDSIPTPQEGMRVYRKDIDCIEFYDGTRWINPTPVGGYVATIDTTTSSTPVDLASVGPSVTVVVPASGKVELSISLQIANGTPGKRSYVSVNLSGANTVAATNGTSPRTLIWRAQDNSLESECIKSVLTGLTPGSTTFKLQYCSEAGGHTGVFAVRSLTVTPII